jgi:hypothetical protein
MLFSPLDRCRSALRSTVNRSKYSLLADTSNLPVNPLKKPWPKSQSQPDRFRFLLLAFVAAVPLVLLFPWFWHRENKFNSAQSGLANALPLLESRVDQLRTTTAIASPQGWQTIRPTAGLTAYLAPEAKVPIVLPSLNFSSLRLEENLSRGASGPVASAFSSTSDSAFDGTRKPYVTDVGVSDLKQVAPGRYQWSGVWYGEGYDRVFDQQARLVSPRQGGANIQLNVSWDATITDPNQPNFVVTIESNQDQTTQLTNFSAFSRDVNSGKALDRIDFGQLPPLYRVSLTYGGLDSETKTLPPLGKVSFAYHVRPDQIATYLPLQLAAENQLFEQRLKQFAELETQGWVIEEVPPPDFTKPS